MKHKVVILGSVCRRVDHYKDIVEERAKLLDIAEDDCEINRETYTGEEGTLEMLDKYGLTDRCMIAYCAGCNFLPKYGDERYIPALIIDDQVVLDSCFPTPEKVDEVLTKYLL